MGSAGINKNCIKVSIVVAVYNSEKYLRQTLDSICSQTLKDIEIILVDDGSTDSSTDIINEYADRDSRIMALKQTESSDGAALARNLGVKCARGKYVSILDADDLFEPDMLQKAYDRAEETCADVVIFDGDLFDERLNTLRETGMILRKEFLPHKDVFAPVENSDRLFFMTIGAAWNALFKRDLIERERLRFYSFHHADDLGFVYLGFATAERIAILPQRLVHYRSNNSGSQAANLEKWPEAAAGAMTELKKALEDRGMFGTYKVAFTEIALHYFDLYLNRMPDDESFTKLFRAWKDIYADELHLCDVSDEELVQKRIVRIRNRLMTLTPEQYLSDRDNRCGLFEPDEPWRDVIPKGSSIILYCAGKRGAQIHRDFADDNDYRFVAWVDSKYESYGDEITAPTQALNMQYDRILIAIESEAIFESIRESLIKLGADADNIIWSEG